MTNGSGELMNKLLPLAFLAVYSGCTTVATFAHVTVSADPGIVGITKVVLALDLGGQSTTSTIDATGGVAITFPASSTVKLAHGSGVLDVTAYGFDSLSNVIAHGTTIAAVKAGKAEVSLTLSAGPGSFDMLPFSFDLGGVDLSTPPGLVTNKVDVLFLIDNSSSMTAMQTQLQARFASFFQVFTDLAASGIYADLHIGVVTSDYGAGTTTQPGPGGCQASPGGQKGLLQPLGSAAPATCARPVGVNFIQYVVAPGGGVASSNLPAGQDVNATFSCMANVGAVGCGFEHQLESVYAALHNNVENAGFLRDDAILAVVFLTNEDDGSAPPTTDLFDSTKSALYGAYTTYRQTEYGVACGKPLMLTPYASSGPLTECQGAPNTPTNMIGKEYDLSRYIDYFTQPRVNGGIKDSPLDVILVGIDGPETPVQVILATQMTGAGHAPNPAFVPCATLAPPSCEVRLQHSCQNSVDPAFFGDPSVRLNAVIHAAPLHQITSICGNNLAAEPDFTNALSQIGTILTSRLKH